MTNGYRSAGYHSTSVSPSLPDLPDLISTDLSLSAAYQRRDFLKSKLQDYDLKFLSNIWPLVEKMKQEISRLQGFETSEVGSFRDYNFQNCYSNRVAGELLYDSRGGEWVKKYSCGESVCFWCRTRSRKRVIQEYKEVIKQLRRFGLTHVWRIQRTFPQKLQDKIGSENLSKLRSLFLRKVKKLFGFKTRDNMAVISVVHPVGDSDLLKKFVHFHDIIVPVVLEGESFRVQNKDRLDLRAVQKIWQECVSEVIPDFDGCEINPPHLIPHRITTKKGWKKFCRGLQYDLRSFAKDYEKSAIASLKFDGEDYLVIKCQRKQGKKVKQWFWRIVSVKEYAESWIKLTKQNKIQVYGWLKRINKIYEQGILFKEKKEEVEIIAKEKVEIEIVREKRWDPKKGRVVWVREEYVKTRDNIRIKIGKEIRWWSGSVPDGLQDVFAPATSPGCVS